MDLIEWIAGFGGWAWVVGGLVLLAIELLVPGGFFVWLGAAAVATGMLALAAGLGWTFGLAAGWPMQWLVFGVLSLAGVVLWLRNKRGRLERSEAPLLNKRMARFVGQEAFLGEPIIGGHGRIELGDSIWRITGPDLPAGHRVRIVAFEGAVLRVESAEPGRVETA